MSNPLARLFGRPTPTRPCYPPLVEVPGLTTLDPDRRRMDRLILYLRTDSGLTAARQTVLRKNHRRACGELVHTAVLHIQAHMIDRGTPLTRASLRGFKRLVRRAWRERKAEIMALVPIYQETSLRLH